MDTVFGKLCRVAGYKLIVLIVVRVKFLFGPVIDHLQLIDTAVDGFYLIICISVKANAGGGVRIFLVPYQIRHDALILAAGYQGIAADLRILLDHQHCVAVLGCLGCRGDTCSAGTYDHYIPCILNGSLGLDFHRIGSKLGSIGNTGFLSGGIDGFL